jgi:hypothetical protein
VCSVKEDVALGDQARAHLHHRRGQALGGGLLGLGLCCPLGALQAVSLELLGPHAGRHMRAPGLKRLEPRPLKPWLSAAGKDSQGHQEGQRCSAHGLWAGGVFVRGLWHGVSGCLLLLL